MAELTGTIQRLTYHSPETGYAVLRIKLDGGGEATVVGSFPPPTPGEDACFTGEWTTHPTYGRQFRAAYYELLRPSTLAGIERYLSSGAVHGIGPAFAARLVERFGLETLSVMESQPERLKEVPGIGPAKVEAIREAFAAGRGLREVMVFLQGHGVGPALAARIYRNYGADAIPLLRENPYRLAEEVFGAGFKTADRLARSLGLPPDSRQRLQAGVIYLLQQAGGEGHLYLPLHRLVRTGAELLGVPPERFILGVEASAERGLIIREPLGRPEEGEEPWDPAEPLPEAVYLTPYYHAERETAARLLVLAGYPVVRPLLDSSSLAAAGSEGDIHLAEAQRQALEIALESGVLAITGGPGTGKTTLLRQLILLFELAGLSVLLAAPTGRAAKRLTEATGREAKTVHRLLEYTFREGEGMRFQRGVEHPLEAGVVVIDEASMLDLPLTQHLLHAIRPGTRLILVGDADQLPAVGPGNVLRDLLDSGAIPTTRLTQVFRQAAESLIVANAHRINSGRFPELPRQNAEFAHVPAAGAAEAIHAVVELVTRLLPERHGFDPVEDIQVLAPMRRGGAGVEGLNRVLQEALNPPGPGRPELKVSAETVFRVGDKVMQIRNNYQKGVFNGDIGRIRELDAEEGSLLVDFAGEAGSVPYDRPDLDELVLSYATTVHKAQGSEYPAVVLALLPEHYLMLQRNLLYTAVTRARRQVTLVGSTKAIAMAVRNNRRERRYTRLAERLRQPEAAADSPP